MDDKHNISHDNGVSHAVLYIMTQVLIITPKAPAMSHSFQELVMYNDLMFRERRIWLN